MPRVARLVLITLGQGSLFAAHQESREVEHLILGQVQVRHAQSFGLALDLALIVNVRLGQFVLEESFVVVPGFLRRTVGQARQIFFVLDRLGVFAAALRDFGEQREVETLDRLAAFVRQFGADAAFVFEAGDLVASRAAEMPHPLLAFVFQRRIIHERRIRIRRRLLLLLRHQIASRCLPHPPEPGAGSASPSCSALAVRGRRWGTGCGRDRTGREGPSWRNPRDRYLSFRTDSRDACAARAL